MRTSEDQWRDEYGFNERGFGTDTITQRPALMPLADALSCTYIRDNPKNVRNLLVADIDNRYGMDWVRTKVYADGFPPPQMVVENPLTGHVHAHWFVAHGVTFSRRGHRAPKDFFKAVQAGLTVAYEGDPGYSHHLTRSPFAPGHRYDSFADVPSYTLGELAEMLGDVFNEHKEFVRPKGLLKEHMGSGRSQDLFVLMATWSNRNHRRYDTYEQFALAADAEAYRLERTVIADTWADRGPMIDRDIISRARSTSEWAWDQFHNPRMMHEFAKKQAHRRAMRTRKFQTAVRKIAEENPTMNTIEIATASGHDARSVAKVVPERKTARAEHNARTAATAALRRAQVWTMREEGVPFQVIADTLGISLQAAKNLMQREKAIRAERAL